eukprot:CRZ02539.1 hypothetical protein [Spongospora subterranea]
MEAFEAVKASADIIRSFFEYSKAVSNISRELLTLLATGDEKSAFCSHQLAVKKFCLLLAFVLRFDELKMLHPSIQNDFSYYRRVLAKHTNDPNVKILDEEASFISLYVAQPIPMMAAVVKAVSNLYLSNPSVPQSLQLICNVCVDLLESKRFESEDINQLLTRTMVGAIILYDHISLEGGAFVKKSGINIKKAIQLTIKECSSDMTLPNMLRYFTLHFADESTPTVIRRLLDDLKH